MALCRFSDYQCDLYIYESAFGIECYVAVRRYMNEPEPPCIPVDLDDEGAWSKWQNEYTVYRQKLAAMLLVPIGLPHDGANRTFGSWEDLMVYVAELKTLGYNVPDWVIEDIREEVGGENER